jgi:hypothetical protein
VLGGLGFYLTGRADVRDKGQVDVDDVVLARIVFELADGFQEGETFDVAQRLRLKKTKLLLPNTFPTAFVKPTSSRFSRIVKSGISSSAAP